MNLYKISQTINDDYDTFDSAVVVAEPEEQARMIHPNGREWDGKSGRWDSWVDSENVSVLLVGKAHSRYDNHSGTVIVSSYNAG